MDDSTRRGRQNDRPVHASTTRYSVQDPSQQRRGLASSTPDRYRPTSLNTPTSAPRGMGGPGSYSGYYQESAAAFSGAITQNTMPYQSGYGQDARQTQSFGAYNPTMAMYDVPQTASQSGVYDTAQQFSSRQPTAMQMMSTDVAAPYFSSEPGSTSATSALPPQAQASSGAATAVYQQSQLQGYSSSMSGVGGIAGPSASADVSMEEQEYSAGGGLEEKWMEYQSALRAVFQNVRAGVLESASQSLLDVSNWLLTQVTDLGKRPILASCTSSRSLSIFCILFGAANVG
jgi:hypothetical protein